MANSFAERAHNPAIPRFDFALEDDPRRDAAYWTKKRAELDPVVFAAEYERNFSASVEGVVIPALWVSSALDAHKLLGLKPTGIRRAANDVADSGADANAFGIARDFLVEHVESWKGSADLDIYHSVEKCFLLCDLHGLEGYIYDADGLGASVRGDARTLNEKRVENDGTELIVEPFRGSAEVFDPEHIVPGTERKAEDFFENLKAQAWWMLRDRFRYTHQIVEQFKATGIVPDDIDLERFISISSEFKESGRLRTELSQPVWATSKRGKVMVDKCPVGTKTEVRKAIKSPNLADAVMMLFAPYRPAMVIHPSLLQIASTSNVPQRRY
jgi:hypothetical protein